MDSDSKTSTSRSSSSAKVLSGDVVYTISRYLSGEHCLRVLPLLCKATQTCRFSLSLLGGTAARAVPTGANYDLELDGPIHGIYSRQQDFQRIIARGHSISALRMEDGDLLQMTTPANSTSIFSTIENLYLPEYIMMLPKRLSLNCFPRLTQLEVHHFRDSYHPIEDTEHFIKDGLWKLHLTSLIFDEIFIDDATANRIASECGPPSFAHTLRTLRWTEETIDGRSLEFINLLSRYCRELQDIVGHDYHKIMFENPTVTSLGFLYGLSTIDLTPHTSLTNLKLCGQQRPFFSRERHSRLHSVRLEQPDIDSAIQFLNQCSALQNVTLQMTWWKDIVKVISAVSCLERCEKITLSLNPNIFPPSFNEVKEFAAKSGFKINDNFWFETSYGYEDWDEIINTAPQIKTWKVLWAENRMDRFIYNPRSSFFTSFPSLAFLQLRSSLSWKEKMVNTITSSFPLRELDLCIYFTGPFTLQSQTLRKFTFKGLRATECSNFSFKIPNLTHLSFESVGNVGLFVEHLLDGNPLIHLPQLRVLSITNNISRCVTACEAGHPSLVHITMNDVTDFLSITLRNLPNLRSIKLLRLPTNLELMLDIPGGCDVMLSCSGYTYSFQTTKSNFVKKMTFDKEKREWRERDKKGRAECLAM